MMMISAQYYTTVYYSYFVILQVICGLGKLSPASKIWPRPQRFVLIQHHW